MRDMLDHAIEAISRVDNRTRIDLDQDRTLYLVLLQLIQIVGESARRVSMESRQAHPEVPWRMIIGTRDRLIHGYDIVDRDILWSIATNDLPSLRDQLSRILDAK
ncbi:MAG: HepT-like ribonuclease domain-containing protein [Planctomycetota bacterium]|nr:HepT-like ribonuclease domain-containing protein [Planctomycetota bacterium]